MSWKFCVFSPRGEKQVEAGKGYELDEVLAKADSLIKEKKSSNLY